MALSIHEINEYINRKFPKGIDRNMRARIAMKMKAEMCVRKGCSNGKIAGEKYCKNHIINQF